LYYTRKPPIGAIFNYQINSKLKLEAFGLRFWLLAFDF